MTSGDNPKVLVIGLDGGCLGLVRSLAKAGAMPRMASLLQKGIAGELESVFPPVTAPAWASFMTGKNPGKHGVFNFFKNLRDLDDRKIISHESIKAETLISISSKNGKKVVSVNMPVTYPPPKVDGFVISGMFTPSLSSRFTHPAELYDELKDKLGEYVVSIPFQRYDERNMDVFLKDISHCLEQRTKYGLELMGRLDWDLFMLVFSSTDYVQHAMWDYLSEEEGLRSDRSNEKLSQLLLDFYKQLDDSIDQLLKEAPDNIQVFIISDHGFGPLNKKLYVNSWLSQFGWMEFSSDLNSTARQATTRLIGKIKETITRWDRFDLRNKLKGGSRTFAYDDVFNIIDWPRTKAVCGSYSDQGIYINEKGSWENGIVESGDEYDSLREGIIAELQKLADPDTGKRIPVEIHRREDIYTGPYLNEAPDILFLIDDGSCIADNSPSKELFEKTDRRTGTGTHRKKGILVAGGKGIRRDVKIDGARIIDMAPTILYSMGIEIPYDVDGRVLHEIFEEDFKATREERYSRPSDKSGPSESPDEAYSEEDEKIIEKRLRDLGYL